MTGSAVSNTRSTRSTRLKAAPFALAASIGALSLSGDAHQWQVGHYGLVGLGYIVSGLFLFCGIVGLRVRFVRLHGTLMALMSTGCILIAAWTVPNFSFRLWQARIRILGVPNLGIWVDDPHLGWRGKPNSSGVHQHPDFLARYTIDAAGRRKTPCPVQSRGVVAFVGDSYTFGHGVNDDETYVAVLAREYWPELELRNDSALAWSTTQAFLAVQEELKESHPPQEVYYGWLCCHIGRNYLRRARVAPTGPLFRRPPWFEFQHDAWVFKGRAEPSQAMDESPLLLEREISLTVDLIRRMQVLCVRAGARFAVLLLPNNMACDAVAEQTVLDLVRADGVQLIDLRDISATYFPNDSHPTAACFRLIAEAIARRVPMPVPPRLLPVSPRTPRTGARP